jgi:hypothetical protein
VKDSVFLQIPAGAGVQSSAFKTRTFPVPMVEVSATRVRFHGEYQEAESRGLGEEARDELLTLLVHQRYSLGHLSWWVSDEYPYVGRQASARCECVLDCVFREQEGSTEWCCWGGMPGSVR